MRKLSVFISVVLLFWPLMAHSVQVAEEQFQRKYFPEMRQKSPDWARQLKLSDEQKKQLDAIYAESRPQIQAIMQQIETLHQQMQNIRQADEQKIRTILSEKQLAKFEKIQGRMNKNKRLPQPRSERSLRFKMPEK